MHSCIDVTRFGTIKACHVSSASLTILVKKDKFSFPTFNMQGRLSLSLAYLSEWIQFALARLHVRRAMFPFSAYGKSKKLQ